MVIDDWSQFEYFAIDEGLPKVPCVYFLMNDDELVYIGQTKDLKQRTNQHDHEWNCDLFFGEVPVYHNEFDSGYYLIVEYEKERLEYESMFRSDYWPKLNAVAPLRNHELKIWGEVLNREREKQMRERKRVSCVFHPTTKEEYEQYKKKMFNSK